MRKFNSISISGYHMQEAGATQDLELAYTLADGVEYIRAGLAAGLDIDRFAPRLSFFWAIGMNFFMEVAKLRAARLLWAELVQQFAPKNAKSLALRTHSQTSGWSLTAQDVFNNVTRTCIEAMAATQGAYPVAAYQRPRRGARPAHRLLPPGSPATPSCSCNRRAAPRASSIPGAAPITSSALPPIWRRGAREHIREIEGLGGMARAIEKGRAQAAHRGSGGQDPGAHRFRPADRHRRQRHRPTEDRPVEVLKVDNANVRKMQLDKLARLRGERDQSAVEATLDALAKSAETGEGNLLALRRRGRARQGDGG